MMPTEGATFLSKSFTVEGDITGSEELHIDGRLKGTVTLTESRLTVGPNAMLEADLQVHDAVVHGRVEGNLTAAGRVDLRRTAVVSGNITAARLSVEDGATMHGQVLLTGNQ